MTLKVKKLDPRAKLPTVAHPGEDAGYDVFALEDATLWTGAVAKIHTGIAVEPEEGTALLIRDRSSMASRNVFVTAGVIDSGYRGEVVVCLTLSLACADGNGAMCPWSFHIKAGDKVAQLVPIPVLTSEVEEVTEFTTETARGDKGFGSSGK